jgi:phenylalanine-4-hydroxylase
MIDDFQKTYFVIDSVEQLMCGLVDLDFGPIYETWRGSEPIPAGATIPGDRIWQPHSQASAS